MIGPIVAVAADDWRWGVRFTAVFAAVALILLIIFLTDPPRGDYFIKSI